MAKTYWSATSKKVIKLKTTTVQQAKGKNQKAMQIDRGKPAGTKQQPNRNHATRRETSQRGKNKLFCQNEAVAGIPD